MVPAISAINGPNYHSAVRARGAQPAGLTELVIQLSRQATATDAKASVLLRFVRALVLQRGEVADAEFQELRRAGFAEKKKAAEVLRCHETSEVSKC